MYFKYYDNATFVKLYYFVLPEHGTTNMFGFKLPDRW